MCLKICLLVLEFNPRIIFLDFLSSLGELIFKPDIDETFNTGFVTPHFPPEYAILLASGLIATEYTFSSNQFFLTSSLLALSCIPFTLKVCFAFAACGCKA